MSNPTDFSNPYTPEQAAQLLDASNRLEEDGFDGAETVKRLRDAIERRTTKAVSTMH